MLVTHNSDNDIFYEYTNNVYNIRTFQGIVPLSVLTPDALKIGLLAFLIGEFGNLYHHYLLSTLRKDSPKNEMKADIPAKSNYSIPKGALFEYVTMPHYLFELIAWLGIAIVAQDFNVFMVFASMFTYLLTRAKATKTWYLKNVENYPVERKFLIPFLI